MEPCCSNDGPFTLSRKQKGRICRGATNGVACTKRAYYNFAGETIPMYCGNANHKLPGMQNIKKVLCENCTLEAYFGFKGEKARFCKGHSDNGMVNVKSKQCEFENCETQPYFNVPGGKGRFCVDHAEDGMIDVRNKLCIETDCEERARYRYPGMPMLYCQKHALNGMRDPTAKLCMEPECEIHAIFGNPGEKAIYCNNHKEPQMVDVHNRQCRTEGCTSKPSYDVPGGKGVCCAKCAKMAPEFMVNVFNKQCKLCPTLVSNKAYKGYCYRCFIHTFPDNDIVRNHKTKERAVADFLRETYPDLDLVFDRSVIGGCSNKRPDVFLDMGDSVLVVEIDENQHSAYECSCENRRLMQLFEDAGSRPLHMIRFNPDQYYDQNQKSVPSCWGITKERGLMVVKDAKKKEWEHRLDTLKNTINIVMDITEHKEISVTHLFYDGFKV